METPLCSLQTSSPAEWLLDTGATNHMTPSRHWLDNYTLLTKKIRVYLGDDHCLQAAGIGNMHVSLPSGASIIIKDIFHIPCLSRNLVSVSSATSTCTYIEFFHGYYVVHFKLPTSKFELIKLPQIDRLYPIPLLQRSQHAVLQAHLTIASSPSVPLLLYFGTTGLVTSMFQRSNPCTVRTSVPDCLQI
ncbi:hypothetical protein KP509_06G015500 [Ceratopteris richardii]|uniref:Retrovirus-related Pol polyprotein from transposon TNT 1-94-like beta-barrel domain-containing protein n=1 Tax=Ceratopteris richardii TaxID=49495 RepID=A0A8T2UI91_CERRI|nr:hypothetical protein KP509_06G015500 [Ceratopteris richardii]